MNKIIVKNEQLRYCMNRLNNMECKTDGDLIFQGQCMSAIWNKVYKEQPELNKLNSSAKTVDDLKELLAVQGQDGNWNQSDYMCGLYNGLEIAVATLENREPVFRTPKEEEINE